MRVLLLLALASSPAVHFKTISERAGVDFRLTSGSAEKAYILESMSGGLGFIDYDNDGWVDLYFVNGSTLDTERKGTNSARNQLYRNNRDGTFTNVTEQAGVGDRGWGMGVCVGDVNNDGFDDLYVANYGPNVLYLNKGDGTFRDFSTQSGTNDPSWSSSGAFADYDRDGDLDLYVSNYLEFDVHNPPKDSPLCRYRGVRVQCGPRGLTPTADRLYENQGDGTFVDVGKVSGIVASGPYYGLGVIWSDFDDDGDPDLFVANDSTPNFLFENQGDKTFQEIGALAGVAFSEDGREQASMGVDFGDYDNDGDFDLIVTNFSEDYNTLYRNEGSGLFTDVSFAAELGEIAWPYLGWGVAFFDFDLDGFLDLVVANGHVYPEVDHHSLGTSFRQRSLLFRNLRNGKFGEIGQRSREAFEELHSSRGLAVGDLNNDGRLDLVITHLGEPPSIVVGRAKGNWLLLKLQGGKRNRSAIGTRVTVRAGDLIQVRELRSGGSYQSQNDLRIHFGLGSHTQADEVRIRWSDGSVQTLKDVTANQILTITEAD